MEGSIESAIDKMEVTKFHYKMLLLSAAGVFLDGYDLFIISVVLLFITPLWVDTLPAIYQSFATGLIAASALIGMFVGALTLGHYTDKMGRKTMYVIDLIFFVVFAGLSALSQNIWELIIFRFLLGIGIGADYPISSTYISEFAPASKRGKFISSTFTFWGIGALTAALVGYILAPMGQVSWRYMLVSGIVPAIIVILLRTRMPESPRWLVSQGKVKEAVEVLKSLNANVDENAIEKVKKEKTKIKDLLSPIYIRRTIFAWIPWFFMDIAVYGIGMFQPTILKSMGFKTNIDAIVGTAILDSFGVLGFILAILFIEKAGRLKLQVIGFMGMGLSLLLLGLISPIEPMILLVLFAIFQISENAGPNTTTWVIATELFPTRLRATAQGSSAAISRLGAITGVFFLPIIKNLFGLNVTMFFVSTAAFLGLIITLIIGEETRALSLEEASTVFREFSNYIKELGTNVKNSATTFYEMVMDFDKREEKQKKIKDLEHLNDRIVSDIFSRLNRKFPSPIDTLDVAAIIKGLDNIIDSVESASKKIVIYGINKSTPELVALGEINLKAVTELYDALNEILAIRLGEYSEILERCDDIHKLENYADDIVDNVLKELVNKNDPNEFIKFKEIYESCEKITDMCDDVADIIRSLIIKYS